ncbi:YtxH domain-containing protein [Pontibacter sp. 172403-2]|uniref:YtxH domain-containing protein n=1 Tax=Pontibacter rufus TaxID=2791028 RepID=UPI0018AFEB75|nr:YtxH domain-containing protein [Pontibacter sp. 172403-2]MBF9252092.1 YtxH domain-containing protein [Pontibacter sp. 172403-2]
MECRSLGEEKGNYTNAHVRQIKQKDTGTSRHESSSGNSKLAVGLLAGAGVGVLAGMLLAPENGKALRRQVMNSASKVSDQVTKSFSAAKDKVSSWTSQSTSGETSAKEAFYPSNSGNVHKSPYTDENKWSDEEVKSMTGTPRPAPGV